MSKLDPHKTGHLMAIFMALVHFTWSLLVATGLAQGFLDWIFALHFLSSPYKVQPFSFVTAIALTALTAAVGYVFGAMLAAIWNRLQGRSKQPGQAASSG